MSGCTRFSTAPSGIATVRPGLSMSRWFIRSCCLTLSYSASIAAGSPCRCTECGLGPCAVSVNVPHSADPNRISRFNLSRAASLNSGDGVPRAS